MMFRTEESIVEASLDVEVAVMRGWRMVRIEAARLGLVQISVARKLMLGIKDGRRKVSTRSVERPLAIIREQGR